MAESAIPFEQKVDADKDSTTRPPSLCVVETPARLSLRPDARGKFLFVGDEKLWVRGVTYGTFRPDENGHHYPAHQVVKTDFAAMAANGINTVRLYTVPPRWLLDSARTHGLWVMVGLPWEQHVAFFDSRNRAKDIEARLREGVRECAGHPAVLCYAVGNEIPASIVRWYGRRRIERFIKRLYQAVKDEDPGALVTYVNFPTTEYLDLSFVDVFTFNVYLEDEDRLSAYLKRLHNIAGDKPVVLAEIGLDSSRHGKAKQAEVLEWQIRTSFSEGCCGVLIFAWTDEWHRGGHDIEDWDFGLTTRGRTPKPALNVVHRAFDLVPFSGLQEWPRISVVVCSFNGALTIRDTLEACKRLNYPDYEVIVVSDGSTDATPYIAREYDVRLICTENQGLSAARNVGLREAAGDFVAYTDDDAYPDRDWLRYLVQAFKNSDHVGVGGPNLLPPKDGDIAACVYNAPGGPVNVLIDDETAEHIAGCNMAYRVDALMTIGGFDPRFRAAGDDVDMCWRLQEQGWTLGFSPSAVVWHHRRNSIRAYWKQQQGYGKAEALLEEKWPAKYNGLGHLRWVGRLYGPGLAIPLTAKTSRVYHGVWGSAFFQSLYQPAPSFLAALPLMPEWYLVVAMLAGLSALGSTWPPMLVFLPALTVMLFLLVTQAAVSAARANFSIESVSISRHLWLYTLTTLLHLVQPLARLIGRMRFGLVPWRYHGAGPALLPLKRHVNLWDENWMSAEERLATIEQSLRVNRLAVRRGGVHDRWDFEVRGGLFGGVRALMAIEEHGAGRQYLRFRVWPRWSRAGLCSAAVIAALACAALVDKAWFAGGVLTAVFTVAGARAVYECGAAMTVMVRSLSSLDSKCM
jgi:GT2 family glycosyltransferase